MWHFHSLYFGHANLNFANMKTLVNSNMKKPNQCTFILARESDPRLLISCYLSGALSAPPHNTTCLRSLPSADCIPWFLTDFSQWKAKAKDRDRMKFSPLLPVCQTDVWLCIVSLVTAPTRRAPLLHSAFAKFW